MPRPQRIEYEGAYYHVMTRGRGRPIFRGDEYGHGKAVGERLEDDAWSSYPAYVNRAKAPVWLYRHRPMLCSVAASANS